MIDLSDALQTFIQEGRELLEQMEASLLRIEGAPDDAETLNAIFRAAHTIKGSAGLFGLDHLVAFAHVAEGVLDRVRRGELRMDARMVALFLDVCDHIGALLTQVGDSGVPTHEVLQQGEDLRLRLNEYSGGGAGAAKATQALPPARVEDARAEPMGGDSASLAGTDNWHISLRFGPDVLRDGMDPLSFVRYLTTFGRIASIVTLTDAIPRGADMDPEACYLGFEISLHTDADKAAIDDAFEFVRDNCRIRIVPPHSKIEEYLDLISEMPNTEMRLGEILVACGTLTPAELEKALSIQSGGASEQQALGEVLVEQHMVGPVVVEAALAKQKQAKDSKTAETALIRVNAEKLDHHINLIGELIISSASAGMIALREGIPELFEAVSRMSRLVEEVRDSALGLRMVQIGATFNKFQRVVHDVSVDLGKDIRLEVLGAETELDKTVVEKIGDPLTHLVRNSMDHGIEPADQRVARGKPPFGTITLNAFHDSGSIVIEVKDDGGGLNRKRILEKAIERNIVKPDQALADDEILGLIFEPGFSTAEKVNNLSGRGVGMDVVRKNIQALRGTVDIESTEEVGTTMRIRLPLTLAIIDGFLVEVGASSFVVPLGAVVECVELSEDDPRIIKGGDHLNLRGEVLPFIRLKEVFDVPDAPEPIVGEGDDEFGDEDAADGGDVRVMVDPELAFLLEPVKRQNVVVVQYAGHRVGLVVDVLLGEFQTVIRPLGSVFNGLEGISGFTILGNGMVALILDVPGLVRKVVSQRTT